MKLEHQHQHRKIAVSIQRSRRHGLGRFLVRAESGEMSLLWVILNVPTFASPPVLPSSGPPPPSHSSPILLKGSSCWRVSVRPLMAILAVVDVLSRIELILLCGL